jgi:hypothetical protein
MRPNPAYDALSFLTEPAWPTTPFWLLLLGSCVIAAIVIRQQLGQRTVRDVAIWLLRFIVGVMWWQQSLWKIPPNYGGLIYWMKQMVDHAAIPLQGELVARIVRNGSQSVARALLGTWGMAVDLFLSGRHSIALPGRSAGPQSRRRCPVAGISVADQPARRRGGPRNRLMQLAMTVTAKTPQSGVVKTRLVLPLEVGLPEWPYDARRHALE